MAAGFGFSFTLLLFITPVIITAQDRNANYPPQVRGSYKATGELVETLEDESKLLLQVAFEESYDADTLNSAFNLWIMGQNVTFVEDYKANQTFRYTDGNECEQMTIDEWIVTPNMPNMLKYEDTNGTVRFSLKQLFSLDDKWLVKTRNLLNVSATFRSMPARKWTYEIHGRETTKQGRVLTVYAFWSEPGWNATSSEQQVPLGFIISKMEYKVKGNGVKLHEQFINVFSFVPDAINHKLFEPVQGIVCPKKKSSLPFPDVSNIKAISLHSEVIFPDYQEIKYVDTWIDSLNKMVRIDMERIKDEVPVFRDKNRKYQSEMVLGRMGIVFRLGFSQKLVKCSVLPIKDYDLDIQNLFNFKADFGDWSVGKMFGVNSTDYTYIGKTTKRDIPCHLFQGIRKDWPEPAANVESLWEWCFSLNVTTKDDAVVFRNGEYGLTNVQITILKSGKPGDYPVGFRIYHHFYDVNKLQPSLTDASNFDIGYCYGESDKRRLQFTVDWEITDFNIDLVENATSDVSFIQKWKTALYQFTDLDPNLLRISGVRTLVLKKQLFVKFTILSPHNDLPDDIKKKQITAFVAENNLRDKINKDQVFINYNPSNTKGSKAIKITAVKHSLQFQVNTTFEPHVVPTTTYIPHTTGRTKFPFSLIPDPDESTLNPVSPVTSSGSTDGVSGTGSTDRVTGSTPIPPTKEPIKDPNAHNLHAAGVVATVSIAMLLVGMSIGSAGIFVKMNGLPSCLKPST